MILQKNPNYKKTLLIALILALGTPTMPLLADQEDPTEVGEECQTKPETSFETEDPEVSAGKKTWHLVVSAADLMTVGVLKAYSHYNTEGFIKILPEQAVAPETVASIQAIINAQNHGIENLLIKNTKLPEGMIAGAIGKNGLMIDPQQVQNFTPQELEFVIAHELAHLKQKHMLKQGLLLLSLPFIAHYGLKAWDKGVRSILSGIKNTFGITQDSRADKVLRGINSTNHWISTFCVTKVVLAWQLYYAYSRYCEQQADLAAVKHLKSSEGAEAFFKRLQETNKLKREKNPGYQRLINADGELIFSVSHPRNSTRIAYTRECMHGC